MAKKLAGERNVDVNKVKGTGPNSRIVKRDVLGYDKQDDMPAASASAAQKQDNVSDAGKKSKAAPPKPVAGTLVDSSNYEDLPLTNVRKVIA